MSLSLLVILAVLTTGITAMPRGAPASQCVSFLPVHGNAVQAGNAPFEIIWDDFPLVNESNVDGPRTFVCGDTYTVIINSTDAVNFRGFLIQARLIDADTRGITDTPYGTFTGLPAAIGDTSVMARYGDCDTAQSSATHDHGAGSTSATREGFPYVSLQWTAPSDLTECQDKVIRFRYTAVRLFATWWGPEYSGGALVAPQSAAATSTTGELSDSSTMISPITTMGPQTDSASSTMAMVTVMVTMILFSLGLMQ